ncbi:putative naringenin-chalcone synthase [Rubidibacter lacunae KORDI 51-2]|uniref:Putative naringenin-chalcone synthase n=1 Tax=Rubidibacter lacunae KORDI 51-2 TaxID=582515 RepID=U5DC14_9CHRO|nr:putative naringenin-chalcone synthase [Rubidibacter lacunae]ERN42068.1 putative naringenin-chalcone synthase [Rubidibacter lacunae KORDI 51-2]
MVIDFSRKLEPSIEGIATGVPAHVVFQDDAAEFVANIPELKQHEHRIKKIYKNTRIQARHLAINLLTNETLAFSRKRNTIEERMHLFEKFGVPLATEVASKAFLRTLKCTRFLTLDDLKESVGLIVFVTSTGFSAPGIDAKLVKILGLRRDIARIPINFMGCAAAMNGIRAGCNYVRANPSRKALVICLELSSINAVFEDQMNDVIIHSIFGDGCAAVVIGACEGEELSKRQNRFVIRDNFSYLSKNTEDGIILGVRDNGVTCLLSRELPNYIQDNVGSIINNYLESRNLTKANIDLWVVHPGGTKIVENAQVSLGLSDRQVAHSWEILAQYGNTLSCASLFVIDRMLSRIGSTEANSDGSNEVNEKNFLDGRKTSLGIAFSFSPGVGIEGLLFEMF